MQSFHVLQRQRKPANNAFHPKSSYQGNAWQSHSGNIIGGSHALGLRNKQPSALRAALCQIPDTPTDSRSWASTSDPRHTCRLMPTSPCARVPLTKHKSKVSALLKVETLSRWYNTECTLGSIPHLAQFCTKMRQTQFSKIRQSCTEETKSNYQVTNSSLQLFRSRAETPHLLLWGHNNLHIQENKGTEEGHYMTWLLSPAASC